MIAGALRSALRLSSREMRARCSVVAALALAERVLAPALAYMILFEGARQRAIVVAAAASAVLASRVMAQRSFASRNEAELYRRAAVAVLESDVLQPTLLPHQDARASLFQSLHRIALVLTDSLPNLAANLVAAIVLAVIAIHYEPAHVTLAAALALTAGGGLLFASRQRVHRAQTDAWQAWREVAEAFTDACEGRLELVASGTDQQFLCGFEGRTRHWATRARRAARMATLFGRVPAGLLVGGGAAALLVDAWAKGEPWSVAWIRAGMLTSIAPAFFGVARALQEFTTDAQRLNLMDDLIAGTVPVIPADTVLTNVPALIEWRGFRFSYSREGPDALRDASFVWRTGEVLAITGPNGSGKTTCLRALLGLAMPGSGDLLIDGVPIGCISLQPWRQTITFLPQRPYMPPRATIGECLRFGDADPSADCMRRALARVGVLEGLRRTSHDPLLAVVGRLSHGERQRVAFARVLCASRPLVVLDEPDANLDRDGIALVASLIVELSREHMVLVVAHAPEILAVADRVVTLEAGSAREAIP